jgi:hypothetical protein
MDCRLSPDQVYKLEKLPDEEEVEKIIKQLALNRTPGSDGITAKVIRSCWSFMKVEIMLLIREFWATGELYEEFPRG